MAVDIFRGFNLLRALAAQEDRGAAGDDGLSEVVVQFLFGIGVAGVELAVAGVGAMGCPVGQFGIFAAI
jgi:uncharacterized protein YgfB (UPF0149 family)